MRTNILPLLIIAACADQQPAPAPDDMSATAHRAEAAKEDVIAKEKADHFNPGGSVKAVPRSQQDVELGAYNPTERYLAQAEKHKEHAQLHRRAAEALEKFEAAECVAFSPAIRAACPLVVPLREVIDVQGGVRLRLDDRAPVDAIVAHMNCHLAFARAQGFSEETDCPLYVRGTRIVRGRERDSIEVLNDSPAGADEIRRDARLIAPAPQEAL